MANAPVNASLGPHAKWYDYTAATAAIVPTLLQMSKDVLSYFTSMTCLYNRYWYAEQGRMTLPVALFHVKGITETWQNEVSKKRVIMYEPPNAQPTDKDLSDSLRAGVMQTFMDNVVTQPKSYQLDVIIPYQPVGSYIKEGFSAALALFDGAMELGGECTAVDIIESMFSAVRAAAGTAGMVADIANKMPGLDGVETINKNSLEAMAESGKILTMKMWTGYQYKYVLITGMTITKQPGEREVFRGTIQVQEMPILTMTVPRVKKTASVNLDLAPRSAAGMAAKLSLKAQMAVIEPLVQMLGVREASGETASALDAAKTAMGL